MSQFSMKTTMLKAVGSTIELCRPGTWRKEVKAEVQRLIPHKVLNVLKSIPGEQMYDDTMQYMEEAYNKCGYFFDDNCCDQLCESILKRFEFLKGYHGCRPVSLESYRREGLLVLTPERLANMAFDLFEGTIPLVELKKRAETADLDTRVGLIYFCSHPDELLHLHYSIYGAESLNCLWDSPDPDDSKRFHESQQRCRQRGIPTILVCDVPIGSLASFSRDELAKTLITRHLQMASDRPLDPADWDEDWGFAIAENLPPSCIRAHSHPLHISDPLLQGSVFNNPHANCDWCGPAHPQR